MHKEIADKWVIALRSGRYEQGVGSLRIGGDYCVLGVLCDVHKTCCQIEPKDDATLPAWRANYAGMFEYLPDRSTDKDGACAFLPDAVKQWAGTRKRNPVVNGELLSDLNDGSTSGHVGKHTFEQLADLIEANYQTL